jgi:hypothetical protein
VRYTLSVYVYEVRTTNIVRIIHGDSVGFSPYVLLEHGKYMIEKNAMLCFDPPELKNTGNDHMSCLDASKGNLKFGIY